MQYILFMVSPPHTSPRSHPILIQIHILSVSQKMGIKGVIIKENKLKKYQTNCKMPRKGKEPKKKIKCVLGIETQTFAYI